MSLPPTVNIASHLEDMDSSDVFELADQIEELQASTAWQRLQEIVGEGRENARHALEFGPIREQADYSRWMGFLNGCRVQADIAREIIEYASQRRRTLEREAAEERDRQAEEAEVG